MLNNPIDHIIPRKLRKPTQHQCKNPSEQKLGKQVSTSNNLVFARTDACYLLRWRVNRTPSIEQTFVIKSPWQISNKQSGSVVFWCSIVVFVVSHRCLGCVCSKLIFPSSTYVLCFVLLVWRSLNLILCV